VGARRRRQSPSWRFGRVVGVSNGGTFNVAGKVLSNGTVNSGGIENVLSGGRISSAVNSGAGVNAGGTFKTES